MAGCTKTPNGDKTKNGSPLLSALTGLVSYLGKSNVRFLIVMGVFFGFAWAAEAQQFGLVWGAVIPIVGAALGVAVGYHLCKWVSSGS